MNLILSLCEPVYPQVYSDAVIQQATVTTTVLLHNIQPINDIILLPSVSYIVVLYSSGGQSLLTL
jgi:hypothetical protein